jgi:hypothetical protein
MIKGSSFDELNSWRDCFGEEPKRGIKKSVAKEEIQRSWNTWEGDKEGAMAMFSFFLWLQRHRPYFLTFREKYDPWQTVHSWLLQADRVQNPK